MPLWEGGAGKASWRSWVIQYLKTFLNNSREKHRASASMPWVAPVQVGYSPGEVRARGVQHLLTGFFQETVHQLAAQRGKEMVVQEKIQTHTHKRKFKAQQVTELSPRLCPLLSSLFGPQAQCTAAMWPPVLLGAEVQVSHGGWSLNLSNTPNHPSPTGDRSSRSSTSSPEAQ